MSALDDLEAELIAEGKLPAPKSAGPVHPRVNGSDVFALANDASTLELLGRLGVQTEERGGKTFAQCPGCREDGALVCSSGGLKCLHARCAHAGPPGKQGLRSNVDIVALVQGVQPLAAATQICEWLGIDVPRRQAPTRVNGHPPEPPPDDDWEPTDADAPDAPPRSGGVIHLQDRSGRPDPQPPTFEEPMRGLQHLGRVALLGRSRILELAAKPVDYLWQDIAVAGTIVLIAGPPAEGKTTLLFLILVARATLGESLSLLGRQIQPAPAGKYIVLIEGEHSESSASRKLVRSLALMGVEEAALERVIIIARKAVTLGSDEWRDIVKLIAAGLVADVAVDTIARVAPSDANDEREQVAVFALLAQAIEAAPKGQPQPTAWAITHTRKGGTGVDLSDVGGSVQRAGQADTVLLVKGEKVDGRTVSTTTTFVKLREDPDDYPLPVTYSIAKGRDGVTALSYTDKSNDNRPLEARILDELRGGPKTKNALRTALGRSGADIEAALSNLFEARCIRTTMRKSGGREWKAFEACGEWEARQSSDDLGSEFDGGFGS